MKLKVKILLCSLAIITILGSLMTVIIEYSMSVNTKQEIILAEKLAEEERQKQEAIEAEKKHQEEEKIKLLNSYDKVEDYYYGIALVKKGDKYGYIDKNGNEIVPVEYDMANNFTKLKFAKVKKNGKWGYIDNTGKAIIPIEYAYCGEVSNDIVAVGNGGKYGFISIDGKDITNGLVYDKVEPFDATTKLAKVVLNQKYGYIDEKGMIKVDILTPYVEENGDFSGEWKQTDIHSSKAGTVTITGQIATSFNFEIVSRYFSKSDTIMGTADIIKPNTAEYNYSNGGVAETLTFTLVDGQLVVTAKNGGSCGMDKELTAVGTYTLEVPVYTNAKVMSELFDDNEKLFTRIKNALGEEIYGEYFLYGFKNGEYTETDLDEASDIIRGTLYTVKVPTLEKDFKLLISNENVYFFAKHLELYKTDDLNRQSIGKMPSAIAFDEL